MSRERYFDNAATSPLDPRVLEAMLPWMRDDFGNANSIHTLGLKAREAVEHARAQVAEAIGAEDPSEIVFTSGATEANNWLFSAFPRAWVSPVEHSSIWEQVAPRGLRVLPNNNYDWVQEDLVTPRLDGLVSLMSVNNETGAIYPLPPADLLHTDATQAIGRTSFRVGEKRSDIRSVDFVTFSAHKFHGPKGIGALYARDARFPPPLLYGGEHEEGHRAGTLNVPAVIGMGEAIRLAVDSQEQLATDVGQLGSIVLEELASVTDWHQNGAWLPPGVAPVGFSPGLGPSPFILSLSFLGIEGETLVIEMDRQGYAISSGAACSSRSTEPSHVLTAMGYPLEWIRGTIRISFGRFNSIDGTRDFAKALSETVLRLREGT
jgi:cysteine desulfurase